MGAPPRLGGVFGISHKLLDDRARWRPGHLKSSREKQNKYPPWPEGGSNEAIYQQSRCTEKNMIVLALDR